MAMLTHDARVQKIAETLRSYCLVSDWPTINFPRIGAVRVHVVSREASKAYGWNEVWARIGDREFRGSAEKVSGELCKLLKAPSKAVSETADVLRTKNFDGFRPAEMAAAFDLDVELTFRALDFLAEQGVAKRDGDRGWFKTAA